MSYSLNEIGGLCKRATRGAGLSWGLAEDAARGARWLCSFGLPGPQLLAGRLTMLENDAMSEISPTALTDIWSAAAGRLCPLITGAALSDSAYRLAVERTMSMHDIVYPLLVLPFAADVAFALDSPVKVEWNNVQLTTDGSGLCIAGAEGELSQQECECLNCSIVDIMPEQSRSPVIRGEIDDSTLEQLSAFASRTYAPATEESRLRGAGAGTPDDT